MTFLKILMFFVIWFIKKKKTNKRKAEARFTMVFTPCLLRANIPEGATSRSSASASPPQLV